MSDPNYSIVPLDDVSDPSGDRPGEIRFLKNALGVDQVTLTHRTIPAGVTAPFPHHHKTQEEVLYIISGELELKLDDAVEQVGPRTAVRIGPGVAYGYRNVGTSEAELLIISDRSADPREDSVMAEGFWPGE